MSTSWRSPFPILPAPQTTPVSTNPKSLKRPIHNPYDKFTKPEFDEWIGGITSALRRALGEETQEDAALDEHLSQDINAAAEETFLDHSFEDSFADIQSRRAKGKAKDPREGPGLGAQQNPIELLSDSESGAESEEEYEEYSGREAEGFGTEGEDEGHDVHHQAENWTMNRRHCLVDPQVEKDEAEELSSREESPDVIEICSDEEDDTQASVHDTGYSSKQYARPSQLPPDEVEDKLGPDSAVLYEQEGQHDTEEVEDFPPSIMQHQPSLSLELPDPWQGPRTYAEDFYTGGDFNAQDHLDGVSPSSLTPVHDAHVNTSFSNIVKDGGPSSGVPQKEPAVVNVDVTDEALPDSSPPPSSPVEVRSNRSHVDDYQLSNLREIHGEHEEPENILDHLYREADSLSQDEQQMIFASSFGEFHSGSMSTPEAYSKPTEHLDWNWPPAFPRGKFASRAGHLETSSPRAGVDNIEEAQDDVIDDDAEHNEEEDGSDEIPDGPIPLGTSDLEYDTEIHQEQDEQSDKRNGLGVEVVEEVDIQAPETDQFPPSLDSRLNADERAAVESFFDLLNCGALPSANVTEQVETALADISGMVTAEFLGGDMTSPPGIEEAGDIMVPMEASEPGDGELQHPEVMEESSTSIELTPTSENDFDSETLQNVEHHSLPSVAPTSTLDDSLEEQLGKPNDEPSFIVVEIEAISPIPRGVSEGVEVTSFIGDVSDLDGEYVVEEPPSAEGSVEPEAQATGPVNVLVETVPVTPKPASAKPSSFDNHNASVFPMPIFCDPSLSDPIISSGAKHPQQTPPRLVKLPGTPHIIISPHSTPRQPTPVSVPVSTSMLHTSRRVSPSEGSSGQSGLFTPREGEPTGGDTGDVFGTPSPSHADLPLPSSDDVMASVTSALEEESRSELNTTLIDVSDDAAVTEPSPTGTFTSNQEDCSPELMEAAQLDVSHPLSVDADAENETDRPPTELAAGHHLVADDTTVASLEFEEVQRAARSTLPAATDQMPPSGHDHPEEALALTEALPAEVLGPVESLLLSPLSDQESLQSLAPDGQVLPESNCEPGQGDSLEDNVSKDGLEHFTNVPDTPYTVSDDVREPGRSGDAEDQKSQKKPSKRKIMSPVQTSSRLTRSMSSGHKKSQGDHKAERIVPSHSRKRKLLDRKDGGSDHGSASSGASTAAKLLKFNSANGSRASSIVSSAPSDSSSIQHPPIPPPLFHAHGAMHHRHRPQLLPSVPIQTHNTKTVSPEPSHSFERQKNSSSVSAPPRALSSNIQRPAASTNSPVTRSNCRFHKISLPKVEGGPRVCFVVPGCSLGDKELMDEEEIQDHGPATYEDYPRLVGNIEALDFNPYLVGILRQLVGVDLIRENEVFFLLQPGEEAQYKKKGRKSAAGSKLVASLSQSATASPQVSVASRRSPVTPISRPPVSTAGSIATSFGSSLSEAQLYKHTSSLFSASSEELSNEEDSFPKYKRRRKESVSDKETRADVEGDNIPQNPLSKGPQRSTLFLKRRRSKRQGVDSAAYKPHTEDVEGSDSGADRLGKDRRKTKKIKGKKRSRVADEEQDSQAKRQKQVTTE